MLDKKVDVSLYASFGFPSFWLLLALCRSALLLLKNTFLTGPALHTQDLKCFTAANTWSAHWFFFLHTRFSVCPHKQELCDRYTDLKKRLNNKGCILRIMDYKDDQRRTKFVWRNMFEGVFSIQQWAFLAGWTLIDCNQLFPSSAQHYNNCEHS